MKFKVVVHKRAVRYLKKLPDFQREKIKNALNELGRGELNKFGIKSMMGEWLGYKRIRIGDFRVIFWIDNDENTIYIDHVGPRGDIYK